MLPFPKLRLNTAGYVVSTPGGLECMEANLDSSGFVYGNLKYANASQSSPHSIIGAFPSNGNGYSSLNPRNSFSFSAVGAMYTLTASVEPLYLQFKSRSTSDLLSDPLRYTLPPFLI